jgi:hypothetical protein
MDGIKGFLTLCDGEFWSIIQRSHTRYKKKKYAPMHPLTSHLQTQPKKPTPFSPVNNA